MDTEKFRSEFPALSAEHEGKRPVYFDNACSLLKPKPVIEAVSKYLSENGACGGGRSGHLLSQETEEISDGARKKTAEFLGAGSPSEIIFTNNTSAAVNLAARAFPYTKGKNEVVLTVFNHHSSMLPFLEQQKAGRAEIKIAGMSGDNSFSPDAVTEMINEKTALVVVPRASNVTGEVFPLREIIKKARAFGASVLADDAQYLGCMREDAAENGLDMIAFSGHKIGAPTGTGALYCRAGLMKKLISTEVGGGTVSDVKIENGRIKASYLPDYRRFEPGIQNYAGQAGLGAAIDFLNKTGKDAIKDRIMTVSSYCRNRLEEIPQIEMLLPKNSAPTPIVSFYFKDSSILAQDFNLFLNNELPKEFICIRVGHHCAIPYHAARGISQSVRLSFFAYNTEKETDIFISALKQFLDC